MKKLNRILILGSLVGLIAGSSYGSSTSFTLASGTITNISPKLGSLKLTGLTVSSSALTSFNIIDSPTNWLAYTNSTYTYIQTYGTNYVTTWTNYYGVVNSTTNPAIYDVTNTMAATVNLFPTRISGVVSNSTVNYTPLNYYFVNGAWFTNSGAANITVTATYQQ